MKISFLLLAKHDSKRLTGKNLRDFNGKPMFLWNVEKCLDLNGGETYVSSNSDAILSLSKKIGAIPIKRPDFLCGKSPNIPSYQHAQREMQADIIIAVQANSPTLLPGIIYLMRELMMTGCPEIMTCHPNYKLYGSIWALTGKRLAEYDDPLKPKPHILVVDNSVDVHTKSDYVDAICQSKLSRK